MVSAASQQSGSWPCEAQLPAFGAERLRLTWLIVPGFDSFWRKDPRNKVLKWRDEVAFMDVTVTVLLCLISTTSVRNDHTRDP